MERRMADVNGLVQIIIMGSRKVEGVVVTREGEGTQRPLWSSGGQVRRIALRRMVPWKDIGIQASYCSGGTEHEAGGVGKRGVSP